jgi:hypothetical protein
MLAWRHVLLHGHRGSSRLQTAAARRGGQTRCWPLPALLHRRVYSRRHQYFAIERSPRLWWSLSSLALAVALGLTIYAGAIVRPQVDAVRTVVEEQTPDPARKAEFDRLHRLSVMLNVGVMVLNLAALLTTASALTPNG